MNEFVRATYYLETPDTLEAAALAIAGEQSTGTFTKVYLESDELTQKYGAKVGQIQFEGITNLPSLPGKYTADSFQCGYVTIEYPLANINLNLGGLFTTIAGNLFELNEVSAIRLEHLELPDAFYRKYSGPKFGVAGTRELTGVRDRPLIGTIIKPSVGLSASQTAELAYTLAIAGIDFIKDDELLIDPVYAPFEERARLVLNALERAADKTGRKVMYACNVTGDLDLMLRRHDYIVQHGGICVMINVHIIGLAATHKLASYVQVPIHGHRAAWGMFSRYPALGMSTQVMQKLCHLSGVDQYHTNGLFNKFWEPNDSVVKSIKTCLEAPAGTREMMPVLSSGQTVAVIPETYRKTGSVDFLHLAGGGILSHPDGPEAGVESMRVAWEATLQGISLSEARRANVALDRALSRFRDHS